MNAVQLQPEAAEAATAQEEAAPAPASGSKVSVVGAKKPHAKKAVVKPKAAKKLVCRYCGSDDLSPSFKKRRDARCRRCFQKRYGSKVKRATAARKGRA